MKPRNRTEELLKSGNSDDTVRNSNNTLERDKGTGQKVHNPKNSSRKRKHLGKNQDLRYIKHRLTHKRNQNLVKRSQSQKK